MKTTYTNGIGRQTLTIENFGGYSHKHRVTDGYFYDMKNMSAKEYPLLSVRDKRSKLSSSFNNVVDIESCNVFGHVRGNNEIQSALAFIQNSGDNQYFKVLKFDGSAVSYNKDFQLPYKSDDTRITIKAGQAYVFPQALEKTLLKTETDSYKKLYHTIKINKPSTDVAVYDFTMSQCFSDGTEATDTSKASYKAQGVNVSTTGDGMAIFTDQAVYESMCSSSGGSAVSVDATGKVVDIRKYGDAARYLNIVTGGYVLHGVQSGNHWIRYNVSVGNYISYSSEYVVKVFTDNTSIVVTEKPQTAINGTKWIDSASGKIYVYYSWNDAWNEVETSYIKLKFNNKCSSTYKISVVEDGETKEISSTSWSPFSFREGDAVTISGLNKSGDDNEYDSSYVIEKVESKYLVLNGHIDNSITRANISFTIERKVPKMDFVIQCANRLWGCYYGLSDDGNEVINEIYCSAQGDPYNFYKYENTAADSWTATIGEDGKWTGAIVYGDYPLFFKENCFIRIYGSSPSTYETGVFHYPGCREGSHNSAKVVGSTLYYHSRDGIMTYSGGVPYVIDDDLHEQFTNVAAGALLDRYYFSGMGEDGTYKLFVYNATNNVWHKEDNLQVVKFVRHDEQMYMLTKSGDVYVAKGTDEGPVEWYAETGNLMFSDINERRLCELQARIILPVGSEMSIEVQYDDSGVWEHISTYYGEGLRPITERIVPVRCDRYKLKLSGKGDCKVISLTQLYESNSNMVR